MTATATSRPDRAPAGRAFAAAGYQRLEEFSKVTEAELLALHGVGPKAIRILRAALNEAGSTFDGRAETRQAVARGVCSPNAQSVNDSLGCGLDPAGLGETGVASGVGGGALRRRQRFARLRDLDGVGGMHAGGLAHTLDQRVDEGVDVVGAEPEGASAEVLAPQRQDHQVDLVVPGQPQRATVAPGVEEDLAVRTSRLGRHAHMMPLSDDNGQAGPEKFTRSGTLGACLNYPKCKRWPPTWALGWPVARSPGSTSSRSLR